jgi:hypothetical protein
MLKSEWLERMGGLLVEQSGTGRGGAAGAALLPPLFGLRLEQDGAGPERRLGIEPSPGLRHYAIRTAAGRPLGDLHGVILERATGGAFAIDGDVIEVAAPVPDIRAFEDAVLDRIRGTFVVVTGGDLPARVYPDCGATLPVVYCPETRVLGGSAAMILDEEAYRARFLAARHRRLLGQARHSWMPGTLTVHAGVFRLLPNHFLDLETWQAVRYWPRDPAAVTQTLPVAEVAGRVATGLQEFIADAAGQFRIGITLTGGLDSRLLLAASRAVADRVEFFTITFDPADRDQVLAEQIASGLGLPHRLVPCVPASAAEREVWDRAVGNAVCEAANRTSHPTLRGLGYDVILTGAFGATGKGSYYARDHATINDRPLTAASLLARMACPQDPELTADLEAWLAGLAGMPPAAVLDLAYVELRSTGWSTAQHVVQCALQLEMNPIAQRDVLAAFIAAPPSEKAAGRVFPAIIARMWPELVAYPVNRYGDHRDLIETFAKLFDRERLRRVLRRWLKPLR